MQNRGNSWVFPQENGPHHNNELLVFLQFAWIDAEADHLFLIVLWRFQSVIVHSLIFLFVHFGTNVVIEFIDFSYNGIRASPWEVEIFDVVNWGERSHTLLSFWYDFPYVFLKNLVFCLCFTAPRVSRAHMWASQNFSAKSWVCSYTVGSVSGGLENSQSGRRLRLRTLARRGFLLSTCGLLCYTGTLRMGGLTPIHLEFLSSICRSHLPELYCGALLAHFLVGDTEKYGGFLCSEGSTPQSCVRCRNWFPGLYATFRGLQTAKPISQRMLLPYPPALLLSEGQWLSFVVN